MRKLLYCVSFAFLAACGDPAAEFQLLSEQDLPENAATVEVAAVPAPEGASLLERLLGATATPESEPSLTEDTASDPAGLVQKNQSDSGAVAVETPVLAIATTEAEPDPAEGTQHKSIFGINKRKPKAAVSEIAPGTHLPYGKVARICGLPKRALGKQVAQYPEKRPQHRIYDSAAGSTAPRTFYVTGFDDGCARQFTASLAMFGSASMHEQLRYGLPAEVQPYSATDKAYEKLKSRVCGVSRKKPCGAKVTRMEKNTVFLSIYERFGSNPRWTNLLLHNGDVLAQDAKGG